MVLSKQQITKAFDHVWSFYHHKQSKKPALKAYEKTVKKMTIDQVTQFNETLLKSWEWRNHDNTLGWERLLLSTYLNQERWEDEPPTSKQASDTLNELKVAEHLPKAMTNFLNNTWTKLLHVPNFEKAVIERAIAQKLIKKPENLEKLYQFGFKPRG